MPTYEYRRPDGTTFEVFQKISDAPLTEDPETGVPVQRVISGGAGLQFKGDGFYLTDYARKKAGSGSTTASESKGAEASSSNGSDSKASSESKTSKASAGDS